MDISLDQKVKSLAQQIKHYLITMMGKTCEEASDEEFYRALSWVLREEVMIHWAATAHTHMQKKSRRVYYFSMEWLPGRLLVNNITNIGAIELVKRLLKYMDRDTTAIINAERDPGLGNGGLGRLAACFLDALATHDYPAMGYGLRYHYGIFEQELWSGIQIERPDCWLLNEVPWELRKDSHAAIVQFGGRIITKKNRHNQDVNALVDYEEIRALPYDHPIIGYNPKDNYSALTLRLWTTKESPLNFLLARFNAGDLSGAAKNSSLTDVLYPNDKYSLGLFMRIKQEYLLVSAGLQDIFKQFHMTFDDISEFADKIRIQINDTHPTLIIAELMRILTHVHEIHWDEAWEITKTVCSFTNHTILRESLEEWDHQLMREILPRQMRIIEKINFDFCNSIRSKYPNDEPRVRRMSIIENERVRMAHLGIVGSHKVNGVAALHSEILKKSLFKDFHEMFPDVFTNVTNGVTPRRWLLKCNPRLAALITELIGDQWVRDLSELNKLHNFAKDPVIQRRFIEIKEENKERLMNALCKYKKDRHGEDFDCKEEFFLEKGVIFDVQVKRFHEYKRQLMNALHAIILFNEIRKNPDAHKVKRHIIFGGKAAPGYEMAKLIIRLIYMLSRRINKDPIVGKKLKVIFIENYNVSKAELIIPAADLSEQISTAGMEASGTSNMKFAMNGALTIGTEDGANIEMREAVTDSWWPFKFGLTSSEIDEYHKNNTYNPEFLISQDPVLQEVIQCLKDDTFAENDVEKEALQKICSSLYIDRYFVLKDLISYRDTHRKAEALYQDQSRWAEYAIHNIASMGKFSADRSVQEYAKNIWKIEPCAIDKEELKRVSKDFLESDRCFIA
ncbi:MAG: glycogen/starch/alpha-glucan phosphorylase [Chlamydiae bacterium]|nr:glycogen/starch/alpha-glucan phosphorylase [Chlamydiota bacterium]